MVFWGVSGLQSLYCDPVSLQYGSLSMCRFSFRFGKCFASLLSWMKHILNCCEFPAKQAPWFYHRYTFDGRFVWTWESVFVLLLWKIVYEIFWENGRLFIFRIKLVRIVDPFAEIFYFDYSKCTKADILSWIWNGHSEFGDICEGKLMPKEPFSIYFITKLEIFPFSGIKDGILLLLVAESNNIGLIWNWKNMWISTHLYNTLAIW